MLLIGNRALLCSSNFPINLQSSSFSLRNAGITGTYHPTRFLFYIDMKHEWVLNTDKLFATKIIRFCVGFVIILNVLEFLRPSIIQVIHWHTEFLRTQPIYSYDLLQSKNKNKKTDQKKLDTLDSSFEVLFQRHASSNQTLTCKIHFTIPTY